MSHACLKRYGSMFKMSMLPMVMAPQPNVRLANVRLAEKICSSNI